MNSLQRQCGNGKTTQTGTGKMFYTLQNRHAKITVNDFGAELSSVVIDGKERLWQNSDGTWNEHAPLLFPVCGHFGCTVDGKTYPMPPHGFAKEFPFVAEKQTKFRLVFTLVSSPKTEKYYPYHFSYSVEYRLRGRKLTILHTVKNLAETPLYFACGGHESYLLDGSVSDYKLVFPLSETFVHRPHNEEGYLTGARETLGVGNELILPDNYLSGGATVILEKLRSRKVSLLKTSGEKCADISFSGFENLLLWRPDKAKMVCIEPWSNLPDEAIANPKEFSKKDGVFKVEGLKSKRLKRSIKYY